MSDYLNLNPGDIIRHIKRGSLYEVLGFCPQNPMDLRDNKTRPVWIKFYDARLTALVQRNTSKLPTPTMTVLYRAVEPKRGDPWLFIRPISEFTTDRFEMEDTNDH